MDGLDRGAVVELDLRLVARVALFLPVSFVGFLTTILPAVVDARMSGVGCEERDEEKKRRDYDKLLNTYLISGQRSGSFICSDFRCCPPAGFGTSSRCQRSIFQQRSGIPGGYSLEELHHPPLHSLSNRGPSLLPSLSGRVGQRLLWELTTPASLVGACLPFPVSATKVQYLT